MNKERIEEYWNNFFGISGNEKNERIKVVPHNYLEGYNGAWLFQHKTQLILSVEPKLVQPLKTKINQANPHQDEFFSTPFLDFLFEKKVDRIIGPVYQGFYDSKEIIDEINENVRLIDLEADYRWVNKLSKSGDISGWENSGVNDDNDGIYGYVHENEIASIGRYNIIRGDIGFIGTFTSPKYRGQGYSYEVVKRITNELSKEGKLIRYQTLIANKPSIRVAQKVGFEEYAKNFAIRFKRY